MKSPYKILVWPKGAETEWNSGIILNMDGLSSCFRSCVSLQHRPTDSYRNVVSENENLTNGQHPDVLTGWSL